MGRRTRLRWTVALSLCVIAAGAGAEQSIEGKVVRILTGDTITVLSAGREYTVHLHYIDAPDLKQSYGPEAYNNLRRMISKKPVTVSWSGYNRYGQLLGKVTKNGQDVAKNQLQDGYAWHAVKYAQDQPRYDRYFYGMTELDARDAHRGLWQSKDPMPPWDFRTGLTTDLTPPLK
jgi:endonuclease YncB( thermonuclease family)